MAVDFRGAADVLKAAAHPTRLEILVRLTDGVLCVSDMEEMLEASQSNISQHLSVLRSHGLVDYYMDGKLRCYFLKDPRTVEIVKLATKKPGRDLAPPACCPVRPANKKKR